MYCTPIFFCALCLARTKKSCNTIYNSLAQVSSFYIFLWIVIKRIKRHSKFPWKNFFDSRIFRKLSDTFIKITFDKCILLHYIKIKKFIEYICFISEEVKRKILQIVKEAWNLVQMFINIFWTFFFERATLICHVTADVSIF